MSTIPFPESFFRVKALPHQAIAGSAVYPLPGFHVINRGCDIPRLQAAM